MILDNLQSLYFAKDIPEKVFNHSDSNVNHFDRNGFEMTDLETVYASFNGFSVNDAALGHRVICETWCPEFYHRDIKVDHGFISIRFGFEGQAENQLRRYVPSNTNLVKLLRIKPKIGIDLSLDILRDREGSYDYDELLHIEYDCRTRIGAYSIKERIERKLKDIDWDKYIDVILRSKDNTKHMRADDLSDWKARLFGFERTYNTLSAIK